MADPTADATTTTPGMNGVPHPPAPVPDDRLQRIEQAISILAERQAVASAPEGYAPPPASPTGGGIPLSALVTAAQATGVLPGGKKGWLNWPVVREVRELSRMYWDSRYKMGKWGQFGVPGLLILAGLNYLFFTFAFVLPIVAPILERLILLGIGAGLYVLLRNELFRYRAVLDYLARFGR